MGSEVVGPGVGPGEGPAVGPGVGAGVGAGMGILIPEIHRRMKVRIMARYDSDYKGVGVSWNLK